MKTIIYIFLSLLFLSIVFSTRGFTQKKNTGSIKGIVVEKSTGNPLESAVVRVLDITDSSVVDGASTDNTGSFIISDIPDGLYTVKISYIGYSTAIENNVMIGSDNIEVNLGIVELADKTEITQEIDVTSEAPLMTFEAGKKIYDAKKDLTSQSGNTLDLLRNIPSVDVDNDGNVSLRGGGNVKILIDGKPSALLSNGTQVLENIPANLIDKVEVINNPSAKYEAEGVSGIINIIMIQDQSLGYNGNVKVNGGTEDKYNLSLGSSNKFDNLTLGVNYSYWKYFLPGRSELDRTNYISSNNIFQELDWKYKGLSHYGSMNADYEFNNENSLSLVTNIFYYSRDLRANNTLDFYDSLNINTSNLFSNVDDGRDGINFDGTLTYTKKFEEKGRDFTTFINYSFRNENNLTEYETNDFINPISYQEKESRYDFNFLNGQGDYIHPANDNLKLESGIRINARFITGDYNFKYLDTITGTWVNDPTLKNDADYVDVISAAYVNFSGKHKDFSYQAGLRGEQTYLDFSILEGAEKYSRSYLDVFPSINLSQMLDSENQLQASYSYRISRPNLFLLNPFIDYFDDFTKRSGNPYLEPEYIHSTELGYTKYLSIATLTLSGYYRNVSDVIDFTNTVDTSGATYLKPENTGKSNTLGMEFILQGNLTDWWTLNGSFDYFNTNIYGNFLGSDFDKTYNAWNARFSTNAAIPEIVNIQLSYMYFGEQQSAQGTREPMQMVNLAIQKSFLDKKLVLAFRVNDLLNQQRFRILTGGSDFSQNIYQKTSSRVASLTLTYNFGEHFNTKSRRTQRRKQREMEGEIQQSGN
jgi:outer membrane cobalamin receptor